MRAPTSYLECPDRVAAGEPVSFMFVVGNPGPDPIELYLTGREPLLDVVVTSGDGQVVWHRLRDSIHQAILRLELLGPGESLHLGCVWDGRTEAGEPAPEGTYTVVAALLTDGSARIESAPKRLTVTV